MIELENVWTAKTTINLCQGDPNADPTPVDIFSLSEMAEGEKYFVPLQFRPSAKDGWYSLKGHIQRAGHLDGSQLTCAGSPGLKTIKYKVQCFRHSLSIKDFDVLCDSISDKVENEMEYELTLELTKMYVEKLHEQGTFSPLLVAEINKQIDAIDFYKQHIANHFFLDKFNMKKRTTTANECRHRNIKYGDDGIGPSHSLAQSGGTQNAKRKASTNRKQSRDARGVTSVSLWGQNVSHVSPEAGRILLGMWESRLAYDSARIDEKTWLVACLEPDPMQNAVANTHKYNNADHQ